MLKLREYILSGALSGGDAYKVAHSVHTGKFSLKYGRYLQMENLRSFGVSIEYFSLIPSKPFKLWHDLVNQSITRFQSAARDFRKSIYNFIDNYVVL